jgi:outer membrane protein
MKHLQLTTVLIFAGLASSAYAADLVSAWHAAQLRDPEIAAARTLHEQAAFRLEQAQALWAPTMTAGGTMGMAGADSRTKGAEAVGQNDVTFKTNVNIGALAQASIGVQKAWISPEREAQSKQLTLSADVAQMQLQQAQQSLIMRTAQRYFDVISGELTLSVLQRQEKTLLQASSEIKKRQAIGDASVMDVQEANARASEIRAQLLSQENNLAMKKVAYRQLIGQEPNQLVRINPVSITPSNFADANTWVLRAKQQSPQLQMMVLQQAIQGQEAKRAKAGNDLTVDWVAKAQMDRLFGQGMYGGASNQTAQYLVGLQINAPLSTGGMAEAREREALKQVEKLRYDQEAAEFQVEQQVRDAWQSLNSAPARLQALTQSEQASKARLNATRQAHRTGARTTNEWLGAEHDAAQAELAVLQLRIQTVLDHLRLYAASGELDESKLVLINALLK